MLVESAKVRDLLSTTVEIMPARTDIHPTEAEAFRASPKTYNFSMNPMPGLIILLLGIMMSSHHQTSMVSTMVHKQWGTLFVGFALARAVTYILFFLSPPTSVFASRPPSELVSSFCLVAGGLIFMASVSWLCVLSDTVLFANSIFAGEGHHLVYGVFRFDGHVYLHRLHGFYCILDGMDHHRAGISRLG
jgi:hypothetical protein